MARRHMEEILVEYVQEFCESLGMDWYCLTFGKTGSSDAHRALSNQIERLVPVQMAESPADWPGPDWSQAPEWAMWWAMDDTESRPRSAYWHDEEPKPQVSGYNSWMGGEHQRAPDFGYPGHWRDSLRRRPTPAA